MSNQTMNVVGYFNGNKWPVQIVISRLNVTLHLKPGEYVLDRTGRKINDPFFDAYVQSRQLSREVASNPVPLVAIPVPAPVVQPVGDGQSVRVVTEYTIDKNQVRHPVMPQPSARPQPSGHDSPIKAMSVDEAKKLGLIKPTRPVPEDYGAEETDGSPKRGAEIPEITYARDTSRGRKPAPLPKELTAIPANVPLAAQRQALVQNIAKAPAVAEALESPTGFMNTVIQNAPPDSPVVAGVPASTPEPPVEAEVVGEPPTEELEQAPAPPPVPAVAKVRAAIKGKVNLGEDQVPLPEPSLEDGPAPAPAPRPAAPAPRPPARVLKPTPRNAINCPVCNAPFKYRSELIKHARSHPEQYQDICKAFPATPA